MKICTTGALGANRNTRRKVWKPELRATIWGGGDVIWRLTNSWGCPVQRKRIGQHRNSSRLLIPWQISSFVITSDDRLDAVVRCLPPGNGYSPSRTAVGVPTRSPGPMHQPRCRHNKSMSPDFLSNKSVRYLRAHSLQIELPVPDVDPLIEFKSHFFKMGNLLKTKLLVKRHAGIVWKSDASYCSVDVTSAERRK